MEGMDLWTSMFSSDFEEGEPEAELEDSEQYNGNDDFLGDSEILAGDAIDDLLDGEDDEREEEEEEDYGNAASRGPKQPDPDDDALFDFEMEPIVSMAEPQHPVLAPAGPMGQQLRPPCSATRFPALWVVPELVLDSPYAPPPLRSMPRMRTVCSSTTNWAWSTYAPPAEESSGNRTTGSGI